MNKKDYPMHVPVFLPDPASPGGWLAVGRFMPRPEVGHYQLQLDLNEAELSENLQNLTIRLDPGTAQAAAVSPLGRQLVESILFITAWTLGLFAVLMALLGLGDWPDKLSVTFLMAVAALLLLPPAVGWLRRLTGHALTIPVRIVLFVAAFFCFALMDKALERRGWQEPEYVGEDTRAP